jgi:hypothetical protein
MDTTNPHTRPANPPRIIILKEYRGVLECHPLAQTFLLFYAKMDDGTRKTVRIELCQILEGDRSPRLLDRNITRQAKYRVSPAEWSFLKGRYTRKR